MSVVIAINECPVCHISPMYKTLCGHVLCESCYGKIMNGKCPLCRGYLFIVSRAGIEHRQENGIEHRQENQSEVINRRLRVFCFAVGFTLVMCLIKLLLCLL